MGQYKFYLLVPRHTPAYSLLANAMLMCRFAPPLAFNFMAAMAMPPSDKHTFKVRLPQVVASPGYCIIRGCTLEVEPIIRGCTLVVEPLHECTFNDALWSYLLSRTYVSDIMANMKHFALRIVPPEPMLRAGTESRPSHGIPCTEIPLQSVAAL